MVLGFFLTVLHFQLQKAAKAIHDFLKTNKQVSISGLVNHLV